MRERGFDIRLGVLSGPLNASPGLVGTPITVRSARKDGYRLSDPDGQPVPTYLRQLPRSSWPSAKQAMSSGRIVHVTVADAFRLGAPRAGCLAEGRIAVHGSIRSYLRTLYGPQIIRNGLRKQLPKAVAFPSVMRATSRYSRCMSSAGYEVGSPLEAWREAGRRFASGDGPISATERDMAVSDARCQMRSRIYDEIQSSLLEAGRDYLDARRDDMRQLLTRLRLALVRARAIVQERKPTHERR